MLVRRNDYRPPPWLIDHVDLHLELDESATRVRARLEVTRNAASENTGQALFLDGQDLELHAVRLDGETLPASRFRHDDDGLHVFAVAERFLLETDVTIHPDRNRDLMGLYASEGVLCTQCEPEAFRRITFFPDRPDILATFRVTLTADRERYPVLLSNGNPTEEHRLDGHRHQVVWEDPHPKPSYLFALAAGHLEPLEDAFVTASGRRVRLTFYTEAGVSRRGRHAMDSLKRAMAWDESRYGREYDLDVFNAVAISQYTMGAMENKGLNIFNDRYVLADPDVSTDRNYRDIDALIAHEYFHNWSGNRVTCRDWFQLSLKEGFTVFREQQYVADQGWRALRRIEDARLMRERQFAEDASPLSHPVRPEAYREIENFYTDTVYSKGAEVVRMLSTVLGPLRFREATDLYFSRHDGHAATVEDFLDCASEVSGRDLVQFSQWYALPGTPRLKVSGHYIAAEDIYELTIEQRLGGKPARLHFPLAVGFLDHSGRELAFDTETTATEMETTSVLEVREPVQRFRFRGFEGRPVPALLRGFSAPLEVDFDYATGELAILAQHDPDPYVRWDAMQRLAAKSICSSAEESEDRLSGQALETCLSAVLVDDEAEPALAAVLLELPGLIALAGSMQDPDLEAIDRARDEWMRRLSNRLRDRLSDTYHGLSESGPFRTEAVDIGRRALRNRCLSYLAAPGDERARDLCLSQYRKAGNMTDRLAALELLAGQDGAQREEALSDFERRWREEPLSMDQWFAAQARSGGRDGLARVEGLMRHPRFAFDKPNRVRSVVEVFCTDNPLGFNHPDGSGYRFLADCVERLDSDNPPLAAALLRHMVNWTGCSHDLRERRLAELRRLHETPGLSPQVDEVIVAALAPQTARRGV